jgi:hypothetical protein
MAFKQFRKPVSPTVVTPRAKKKTAPVVVPKLPKPPEVDLSVKKPQATIDRNGPNSFILHFNVTACETFDLGHGDRIALFYDAESKRIGFRKTTSKDPNIAHTLIPHGKMRDNENPKRFKVSVSTFIRENGLDKVIAGFPFKAKLEKRDRVISMPVILAPLRRASDSPARGSRKHATV